MEKIEAIYIDLNTSEFVQNLFDFTSFLIKLWILNFFI